MSEAAAGPAETFFSETGPEAFRRYVGAEITEFARKRTEFMSTPPLGGHFVIMAT